MTGLSCCLAESGSHHCKHCKMLLGSYDGISSSHVRHLHASNLSRLPVHSIKRNSPAESLIHLLTWLSTSDESHTSLPLSPRWLWWESGWWAQKETSSPEMFKVTSMHTVSSVCLMPRSELWLPGSVHFWILQDSMHQKADISLCSLWNENSSTYVSLLASCCQCGETHAAEPLSSHAGPAVLLQGLTSAE